MRADELRFTDVGIEGVTARSGDQKVHCPRCHPERRNRHDKSLSVNVERGEWHCHHCGWSSGLVKEARERGIVVDGGTGGGVTWRRGVEGTGDGYAAEAAAAAAPRDPESGEVEAWRPPEPGVVIQTGGAEPGEGALAWFAARGISEATVRRYGIKSKRRADGSGWVHIPYTHGGEVVAVKMRSTEGKVFQQAAGAARWLYGLDDLAARDPWWPAVIVEGELDKLALAEAGIPAAVSLPDGAIGEGQRPGKKLEALEEPTAKRLLSREVCDRIVVATDADGPGEATAAAIVRRLGAGRCYRVAWPEGCKDANDVLMRHGPERLREVIAKAQPIPLEGVRTALDFAADVHDLYTNGVQPGASTGFANMDADPEQGRPLYLPKPGYFTVVTGIPNSGKSNWLDQLMVQMADLHGWRFAVCSPENQPVSRHVAQLLAIAHDRPFLSGDDRSITAPMVDVGLQWLADRFHFIDPEEPDLDLILSRATELVHEHRIRGLVIDPWSELETGRKQGRSETEHVAETLRVIRRWARKHQVHVWLVAHPTKLTKGSDGVYPVPTPYDIAGSAHWYNMADAVLSVWRDYADRARPVEVHVQKCRFREQGSIGKALFSYDAVRARYTPVGQGHGGAGANAVTALASLFGASAPPPPPPEYGRADQF